jgi:hypothetical protein
MKSFTRNDWIDLLKRDLVPIPSCDCDGFREYANPEHLFVTIKTKTNRKCTFGGPVWCAIINIHDKKYLYVDYLSPLKKTRRFLWDKIESIEFRFVTDVKHPRDLFYKNNT